MKRIADFVKKHLPANRRSLAAISVCALLGITIGVTLAFLGTGTAPVVNTFTPTKVDSQVMEEFDGTEKTNVNVTNTGDIHAYIRVRLVTYRVNGKNQRIGGEAELPQFTLGEGWVQKGDYYYYIHPVAPGQQPAQPLTDSMTLVGKYEDPDGGKQAVEVMAEAIQADGGSGETPAVTLAWKVNVDANGTLIVP